MTDMGAPAGPDILDIIHDVEGTYERVAARALLNGQTDIEGALGIVGVGQAESSRQAEHQRDNSREETAKLEVNLWFTRLKELFAVALDRYPSEYRGGVEVAYAVNLTSFISERKFELTMRDGRKLSTWEVEEWLSKSPAFAEAVISKEREGPYRITVRGHQFFVPIIDSNVVRVFEGRSEVLTRGKYHDALDPTGQVVGAAINGIQGDPHIEI